MKLLLKVILQLTSIFVKFFFISYGNTMVKICHYYLKIIDNLENSKKMILMQNNYDIRCSKPTSFPRTFFCICTNNEDIKVYKINWTFYILLYNFSFSCIANNLCKIAKIKIKIKIKKYKKNRQLDSALIFINILRSFIRRSEKHRRNNSCRPVTFIVDVICQHNEYHRCR